jgi:hypothetical protein
MQTEKTRDQTSLRVSRATRDALLRIAKVEMGGASAEDALRKVLFEHQTRASFARLAEDEDAMNDYLAESRQLAEAGVEVHG